MIRQLIKHLQRKITQRCPNSDNGLRLLRAYILIFVNVHYVLAPQFESLFNIIFYCASIIAQHCLDVNTNFLHFLKLRLNTILLFLECYDIFVFEKR